MKKFNIEIDKKKVILVIAAIIVVIYAAFLMMPRDLGELISLHDSVDGITTSNYRGSALKAGGETVSMSEEDKELFISTVAETKVYKNPFYKKLNDAGLDYVGKTVEFIVSAEEEKPYDLYVFTNDIVIIDGVQYRIYGKSFADVFRSITE